MGLASKLASYSAPSNPPPQNQNLGSQNPFADSSSTSASSSQPAASNPTPATNTDHLSPSIPEDAPPAYTPAPPAGDAHLAAGPSRMDFSGPPPMPQSAPSHYPPQSPLENQITGVGIGYGPRRDHGAGEGGFGSPSRPPLPMPPRHNSEQKFPTSPQHQPSGGGPSSQAQDMSPTQVPTPGRPLLRNGQLLVYPKNHFCHKCGNTGYKNSDPSNPHDTDWRKYGKPFTGALAHSYSLAPDPSANPSTQSATNFQRPLPYIPQPAWRPQGQGVWQHPGNGHPPPPSMHQHNSSYGPGPMMQGPPPPIIVNGGGWMPANALVVKPGDPRLGGQCGGRGRELDFLGFDSGKCWQCRGVGRVF